MNYSITLTWAHLIWTVSGLFIVSGIALIRRGIKSSRLRKEESKREFEKRFQAAEQSRLEVYNRIANNTPKTWLPLFELVNRVIEEGSSRSALPNIINAYVNYPNNSLDPISYELADFFVSKFDSFEDRHRVAREVAPYVVAKLMKNR